MTNSIPSAQFQVDFIAYLQRLFAEGDFSATYKFGFLHALADLCLEKQQSGDNVIPIDDLAMKFSEIYWGHTVPYSATNNGAELLLQNSGKQVVTITKLSEFRDLDLRSFSQVKKNPQWKAAFSSIKSSMKVGPLWRLQKLQDKEVCFFYPHIKDRSYIELNPGIVYCFQRFYDLVVSLVRHHWSDKIRNIGNNEKLIGKGDLDDFLFGNKRASLGQVQPVLFDIQKGLCFYCQKSLSNAKSNSIEKGEVDHFIPWARYPHDLGHNFVLAHSSCNNNKRDHLAAHVHSDRWHEQNIIRNGDTLSKELEAYFTCDIDRSEAVTAWAYRLAHQNEGMLWLAKNQFMGAVERKSVSAETI